MNSMKLAPFFGALIATTLLLTGCSAGDPPASSSPSASGERGAMGGYPVKLCIINNAGGQEVDAWHNELVVDVFSGSGGSIALGEQRCFEANDAALSSRGDGFSVDMRVDVFVGTTPDIITFTGLNPEYDSDWGLAMTTDPIREMGTLRAVYVSPPVHFEALGHTFVATQISGLPRHHLGFNIEVTG